MEKWTTHIEWLIILMTIVGGFYTIHSSVDAINARFDQFIMVWHEEAKDFHGRLCRIEERKQ